MVARNGARGCGNAVLDLANAPHLTRENHAVGDKPVRLEAMRLLDASAASSPNFVAAWQDLANHACEPNPFYEPWYLLPSIDAIGDIVAIAALYDGDLLVGIMPMERSKHYYGYPVPHLASWVHANTFCGAPLVRRGYEQRFWRALFARAERKLGTSLFLHLALLPDGGPAHAALEAVLAEQARTSVKVMAQRRALLASHLSSEAYLEASMSAKKRKELRRQHKRLAEEGALTFERSVTGDGLAAWIDEFLDLEAAGWKGDAASALANSPETRRLFTDALHGAAQAGKLERLCLRLDGKPIAMLANFICPPGAYSFKTAYDERYARYSPGLLLQLENLALLDRGDVEWADSCAAEGHPMIERLWRDRRELVGINIALGGPVRRTLFKAMMAYETRNRSAT